MGPYGPIWAHMGPIWAHMGPYGAHMGPYTRKIPKNTQKFLGIPRDLCGDLCGDLCVRTSQISAAARSINLLDSHVRGGCEFLNVALGFRSSELLKSEKKA